MNDRNDRPARQPPGTTLLSVARFFASRRFYEHVLTPTVADMQHEYFAALAEGSSWRAMLARVRGIAAFVSASLVGILAWPGVAGMRNLAVVVGGALLGWYVFGVLGSLAGALLGLAVSAVRNAQLEQKGESDDR